MHPDFSLAGVRSASSSAKIYSEGRNDMALIELAPGTTCAGVFTQNSAAAAPVQISRQHLRTMQQPSSEKLFLLVNSGNANAGVGKRGVQDCQRLMDDVASETAVDAAQVLACSTGVIGVPLPMEAMQEQIPVLVKGLSEGHLPHVARAMMTTDTRPKMARATCGGSSVVGIAKGASMMMPNMATMLAFVFTDLAVSRDQLQDALAYACDRSFHRITIDGDSSTNDTVFAFATGQSSVAVDHDDFKLALTEVCRSLAEQMVRDAEGIGTPFVVRVSDAPDSETALRAAFKVANSTLVKTAINGGDANWGRIYMALGNAGIGDAVQRASIAVQGEVLYRDEAAVLGIDEAALERSMNEASTVLVEISLGSGDASEEVLASDLSQEYVHLNADYRT